MKTFRQLLLLIVLTCVTKNTFATNGDTLTVNPNPFDSIAVIQFTISAKSFDLEGTWNGENIPGRKISITFKEYEKTFILIEKDDQLTRGNYEIDINHNPKWIDLHIKKQGGEEIILGIIEFISKNQIAIQFGSATKRPLEFSTKKSDDDENVVLTRQSE